ncbi:GAF and ANTAR domain-containing protein [Knoellia sp. CPCC 206435]|uniref:GAF and ANTAR domain-containing protein n=1 Tax=Knoellia terrae TaxID=3404797 RepID=UPI003B43A523
MSKTLQNPGSIPPDVAAQLSQVVGWLSRPEGPVTPARVVSAAALGMPHGKHCGLTLLRPGHRPVTMAASDDLPRQVDALQYELGEGPCLDAALGPAVLLSDDVTVDERWPRFGPLCAASTGARSMLSLRLPVGGEDHAAINYYSTEVAVFTDADVTVASVLVPLAALAVEAHLREHDRENLVQALTTSRQISTAVGIIMSTQRVESERAFELLRRASMDLNRKLRDVAEEVNLTGALPSRSLDTVGE